jgi:cell division protein FtsI (penicillin-binding protein 3)
MTAPRYVVFAMLDEPSGTKETLGYATGGWVAAPVVGRVISRIGPMLGIRPIDEEAPAIRRTMAIDVVTKKTGKRRLASF